MAADHNVTRGVEEQQIGADMSITTMTTAMWALMSCVSTLSSPTPADSSSGDLPKIVLSQSSATVPRFDVFEISLQHEGTYENPFFDVSIDVALTPPAGKEIHIGGFYYRQDQWKARFAPSELGRWTYRFTVRDARGQIASGEDTFTCVQGRKASPGFVRRYPENPFRFIFDDGTPYWPIGVQDCWGDNNHNGTVLDTCSMEGPFRTDLKNPPALPPGPLFVRGPSSNPQNADVFFRSFGQCGFNLYRFSQKNCSYELYRDLDHYLVQEGIMTDELLQYARKYGFRVFYGLFGYQPVFNKEPDNAEGLAKVKRFIKYSVDRWGAYVDFWEFLNEQHADDRWYQAMIPYLKSIDPYRHLVTTSWERPELDGIEINAPHWYQREDELESDRITSVKAQAWKKFGKPVVVGEQGNHIDKSKPVPPGVGGVWDDRSALRMRIRNWTAMFNEIAFIFWNTSYARDGHYMNIWLGPQERQYVRAMQDFAYRLDKDVRMHTVSVSRPDAVRGYALASERKAGVYLHHFKDHTKPAEGIRVTVDLPGGTKGYWYHPEDASIIQIVNIVAGMNQLDVPPFTVDIALLVTSDGAPDIDHDGQPNDVDADDDNDGVPDDQDAFPLDPSEWKDQDKDWIGDNLDADDDGDGIADDENHNGIADCEELDFDGDGVPRSGSIPWDAFPLDPKQWRDVDGDGTGDDPDPDDNAGFRGRIALSHDGNFNDEDDWGAFPVAIAILDAFGVKDKLVHIEYNNIIQANDARFEREMTASVLGAAEQYGIPPAILHNCRTDLDGAVESIKNAVNASSPEGPLYYLLAGPMDVPYRGILAADPARRRHVYCISHSSWNDGYGNRRIEGRTKRDLISLGVRWIQVGPGNLLAYPGTPATQSTPAQWALFHWMRDSRDQRLRWLFTRLEAEKRCDVSDATMAYFLLAGDEKCDPQKLAALLDRKQRPDIIDIRPTIRLEAENFSLLENCVPVAVGRQASQNVLVRTSNMSKGILRTEFHEIHAAQSGRYDVGVQYRYTGNGAVSFAILINGVPQGSGWRASASGRAWQSHAVKNVFLSQGDALEVEVQADGGAPGEIDFVQLTYLGLDDPAAIPGQIIVDPANPRWFNYNGGRRCFLFGAGNPEDFFFFGKRQPDGTRTGGKQSETLKKLVGTGANTFHVLVMRDSRYDIELGNGAPDGNPFVDSDITGKLDEDIRNQWEGWLSEMEAAGRYVLLNTEVDKRATAGAASRLYSWTSAMANMYAANAYHRPDKTGAPRQTVLDDGRVPTFMEATDVYRMSPGADLEHGDTLYVLASHAGSYIAHSNNAAQGMGLRDMQAGTYLFRRFDPVDGDTIEKVVAVSADDQTWPRPTEIGPEAALYIKRLDGVASPDRQ
jgi:hypothetical protein